MSARARSAVVGVERVGEGAGLLLHHHRTPHPAKVCGLDPRLERHAGGEVERGRVRNRDPGIAAVEREGAAELSARRPGRVRDRARVAVPEMSVTVEPEPASKLKAATSPVGVDPPTALGVTSPNRDAKAIAAITPSRTRT